MTQEIWPNVIAANVLGAAQGGRLQLPAPFENFQTLRTQTEAWSLYSMAGFTLALDDLKAVEEAPLTPCAPLAEDMLAQMLRPQSGLEGLVPVWCEIAVKHNSGVPTRLLPQIFAYIEKYPKHRFVIQKALGKNAHWFLAQQGQKLPSFEALWQEASESFRPYVLRAWIESDPIAAQQALWEAWSEAPAESRVEFLKIWRPLVSIQDQARLEAMLSDRSAKVRHMVQMLLGQVSPAWSQRLTDYAQSAIKRGFLQTTVQMPVLTPDLQKAGFTSSSKKPQALLYEVVRAAPLSSWNAQSPGKWLNWVHKKEHEAEILSGWIEAAAAQRDPTWAQALLSFVYSRAGSVYIDRAQDLLQALPPDLAQEAVASRFGNFYGLTNDLETLSSWNPSFTEALMGHIGSKRVYIEQTIWPLLMERGHLEALGALQRLLARLESSNEDERLQNNLRMVQEAWIMRVGLPSAFMKS